MVDYGNGVGILSRVGGTVSLRRFSPMTFDYEAPPVDGFLFSRSHWIAPINAGAKLLWLKERIAVHVRRLRDRLQKRVNVGEIVVA